MYACIYVSMYVCMYVVRIYECIYVYIYVCIYVCMNVCMYVSMYVSPTAAAAFVHTRHTCIVSFLSGSPSYNHDDETRRKWLSC